jgi:hypothetical protein
LPGDKRVLDVPPADPVCSEQHKGLAHKRRQFDHLFVCHQIQLVEDGVVLGQVLVFGGFSSSGEPAAS